jgi:hypothetical protein
MDRAPRPVGDLAHSAPAGRDAALRKRAAFGVRHHPRDSNALTVYEVASRRLNA